MASREFVCLAQGSTAPGRLRAELEGVGPCGRWGSPSIAERPAIERACAIRKALAPLGMPLKNYDFVRVVGTGVLALPFDHLLKLKRLYGKLIRQASKQFTLFRVARPSAHQGEICGIGAELVQSFP